MSSPAPAANPEPRRHRTARLLTIVIGVAVLVSGLALIGLPGAARFALPRVLAQRGVDATVQHVVVDVWNGVVALYGLRIGPEDGLALRFAEVRARIDLSDVADQGVSAVRELALRGGELDTARIAGTDWSGGARGDAGASRPDLRAIALPEIRLDDVDMRHASRLLARPVRIETLRVGAAAPGRAQPTPAPVVLRARVGEAAVTLVGEIAVGGDSPTLRGRLAVDALALDGLERLAAGAFARLAGAFSSEADVVLGYDPRAGALAIDVDGVHRIDDLIVERPDLGMRAAITHEGAMRVRWPAPAGGSLVEVAGTLDVDRFDALWQQGETSLRAQGRALGYDGDFAIDAAGAPRLRGTARWRDGDLALEGTFTPALVTLLGRLASVGEDVQTRLAGARRPLEFRLSGLRVDVETPAPAPAGAPGAAAPRLLIGTLAVDRLGLAGGEGLPPVEARGVAYESLRVLADGAADAAAIRADSLEARAPGAAPAWQARGIALGGVSRAADGAVTWREAAIDHVEAHPPIGAIVLDGLSARGFEQRRGAEFALARLALTSARLPAPAGGLDLADAVVDGTRFGADGSVGVARARVAALDVALVEGVPSRARGIEITDLAVSPDYAVRAAGASLDGASLRVDGAEIDFGRGEVRSLSLGAGTQVRGDRLEIGALSARGDAFGAVRAESLSVAGAELTAATGAAARSASARGLEYRRGGDVLFAASVLAGDVRSEPPQGEGEPALRVATLEIADAGARGGDGAQLLSVASASVSRLALGDRPPRAERVDVRGVRAGAGTGSTLAFSRLGLVGIEADADGGVAIGEGRIDDLHVHLVRGADGALATPGVPLAAPSAEPPAAAASGAGLRVGQFSTHGETRLEITDRSVEPPFELRARPLAVKVQELDTRVASARGTVEIDGRLGEFSRLRATTRLGTAGDDVAATFDGRLTGVDLVVLSPYASSLQDVRVRGGRADLLFEGRIEGRAIAASTDVTISKLELAPAADAGVPTAASGPARGGASMSASTALALLRDQDGTVRLKVPISGSLDDPKFDFSDAVGQAVAKAATGAAMLAFQPVGLLVTAASVVGSMQAGIGFEPIAFRAADADVPAEGLTRLDALAGKLAERPSLKIHACGRAVRADADALAKAGRDASDAALRALADARAAAVRAYLSQRGGIQPGQVADCEPRVELDAEGALPRTDLALDLESLQRPGARSATPAARAPQN